MNETPAILQVKKYNNIIAKEKEQKALVNWNAKNNGYGYPISNMFYFYLTDKYGRSTTLRKKGYIAFNSNKAVFGINEQEAINEFNNS